MNDTRTRISKVGMRWMQARKRKLLRDRDDIDQDLDAIARVMAMYAQDEEDAQ